ncbi:MFS transporter [Luteolibacter sp. LG18]|uniref:MFS transporter n=1 Tax=Luteolibacter sp. LG18 TaxID=2819286 RepID=UPI002B325D72|nr:MFS transporter [Luteolibacter sp. LG18]
MSSTTADPSIEPNAKRLLWAGFTAILATGVGFSVRGGVLGQWADQFGFTMTELGTITGGGLTGFGLVIILSSLIADKIGYGKLMSLAFLLHFVSAVLTLATPAFFASGGKDSAYWCLFSAMFIFAVGNGICEAVVNPLTATLFPKQQTHYLNILHAGWPAGLVLGSVASALMSKHTDAAGNVTAAAVDWKIQMSLFLLPVVAYGLMMMGQRFPKSHASVAGVPLGQMIGTLLTPLMLVLLLIHALVGYVELGTDSWISKITGAIMDSPQKGLMLFSYTSLLMFVLRFCAGPIVHRISPIGLLLISAALGCLGLNLLGGATTVAMCVIAATVYALGKTFLWPTMLSVASERFPKSGAIGIGLMGGVGMLSAGLLGGPAIGFKQDYNASHHLEQQAPATYGRYKADKENTFAGLKTVGLDGAKVGVLEDDGKELARTGELLAKAGTPDKNHDQLDAWWQAAKADAAADKPLVKDAGLYGGRMALKLTSVVPATMGLLYLGLLIYFKSIGGYRRLHVNDEEPATGF